MKNFAMIGAFAALAALAFGSAPAIAGGGFTDASLDGSYAGIFSGQVPSAGGSLPILGTGVFVADGHGRLHGRETYTIGTTRCNASLSGTYIVARNGRGTDAISFVALTPGCSSGSYTQSFAIAARGALVLLANTNGEQIEEKWYLQQ